MSPEDADLDQLCSRFGVSHEFGRRLSPILRRALGSPPERRRFLLGLVERSFAREADRLRRRRSERELEEDRALVSIAGTLHAWDTPSWFKSWAHGLGVGEPFDNEGEGDAPDDLAP